MPKFEKRNPFGTPEIISFGSWFKRSERVKGKSGIDKKQKNRFIHNALSGSFHQHMVRLQQLAKPQYSCKATLKIKMFSILQMGSFRIWYIVYCPLNLQSCLHLPVEARDMHVYEVYTQDKNQLIVNFN